MLVAVGLYAGFMLWREAKLGKVICKRLSQPTILLFLALMCLATVSLCWTPTPSRGLQAIATTFLLVICALFIFEFPISKNAPRLLGLGMGFGSLVIALDLSTGSYLLHVIHGRPDDFRYNMVVVTFVTMASALVTQIERLPLTFKIIVSFFLILGVFASESETAKIVLLIMPIAWGVATALRLKPDGLLIKCLLAIVWLFGAISMSYLATLKEFVPSDFWVHAASDDRILVWSGFTKFAFAGLPWGWGIESTSAPEATAFASQMTDAIRAGIVGRLHSHNNMLQIAAELGAPGIILAYLINVKMVACTADYRSNRQHRTYVFVASVLVVAMISHGLWQSWWWAAVLISLYFQHSGDKNAELVNIRKKKMARVFSIPVIQAALCSLITISIAGILRINFFPTYGNAELLLQNILMGFVATFISARFMAFVIRSSLARTYGYGIAINVFVFSLLAVVVALLRLDYLRLELVINCLVSTVFITGFAYWAETQRSFEFHCLSEETRERFQKLPSVRIKVLKPTETVGWRESSGIIVDFTKPLSSKQKKVLGLSALNGVRTFDEAEIMEKLEGAIPATQVAQIVKVTPDQLGFYHFLKRALDVTAAIVLLPVFLGVILIAVLAIKIDDGGPVFFRQDRIGYKGRKFSVWKLRTMREEPALGSLYTLPNDPRITRVGTLLRRTRVDEFPQIFNVLKGEMSWIGPRPESAPLAEWYGDEIDLYEFRHIVRPGITGWAAIRQGNVGAVDAAKQKLYYDFFYIKNYSLELDLLIAMKTMKIIFSGFGAK